MKESVIQMTVAKKTNASKKEEVREAKKNSVKKEEVRTEKQISNTQKCANMIMSLARDAKYTRNEIVASVANALSALSIVTVKTMLSDLQNPKYAKRYSSHTIAVDRESKIVTVASEIKA